MTIDEIGHAAERIAAEYVASLEPFIRLTGLDVTKLEKKIRAEIRDMLKERSQKQPDGLPDV